ncbi:MAG TPA: spermidine/putrescine ABC transporter substrate-binding protein [Alphaproteobacteria bacterium]|nr:spermidine/putrescine ABC transporter substrate-binding protein [Alphaproteobacteria bacterium]
MRSIRSLTISTALAVALAFGLAGPAAAQKITISNWDAYMPPDLLENFTKETGIETELALHATNEEIMGKLSASGGQGFDVVFVSAPFAEALHKQGLAAELDHSNIPNLKNLYEEARSLEYDPGNKFSVPYAWGTTGLCYRSDLVKSEPASWSDLLNPSDDLKGKTTMLATDRWLMAAGLLALGKSVNSAEQADIDEAKALLTEAKKTLLAYDDTTFYSKLVSGEAYLVQAWDGWCNYGIAENPAIKYVVPKEGSDLWVDTMVVLAPSQNQEAAHKFIDYVLRPDVGQWVASNILYKVPNRAAMEGLDPALLQQFPNIGMAPAELVKFEELRDLGPAQKAYTRAVTEITSAQ